MEKDSTKSPAYLSLFSAFKGMNLLVNSHFTVLENLRNWNCGQTLDSLEVLGLGKFCDFIHLCFWSLLHQFVYLYGRIASLLVSNNLIH